MLDTRLNAQEGIGTLLVQQRHLIMGKRPVQMFPAGTTELKLPDGMERVENERGVFHYNPNLIDGVTILALSAKYRENEFLMLGPYSKDDISCRMALGERFTVISEYTPDGVEVRTAVATNITLPVQKAYFERTKQDTNSIYIGALPQRVQDHLKSQGLLKKEGEQYAIADGPH